MQKINPAYLLTLVCETIKTVEVTFDFTTPVNGWGQFTTKKGYTYLTVIADLKPGEDIIVETPDGLKVAQVVSVHDEAEVEPTAPYEYKWAVSRSGSTAREELAKIKKLQANAVKEIASAKKRAQRKKLKSELDEHFGEELKGIKSLDFASELLK